MLTYFAGLAGTEDAFLMHWLLWLSVALLVILGAAIWMFLRKQLRLHQVFFVIVLWMGILYNIVLPPLSAPDEVIHFAGAYEVSSKLLSLPVMDEEKNPIIRAEDEFIVNWPGDLDPTKATVLGMKMDRDVYRAIHEKGLLHPTESGTGITLQHPVLTSEISYLLPGFGFAIARKLNLSVFGLLFLGRFMNLLLFSILGSLSIRRTPVAKEAFFAVALFPMTLEMAGSLSYDAFILSVSFFTTATILDLSFRETPIGLRDVIEMAILAILLSPCKMIYAILFALCLMIPVRRWRSPWQYAGSVLLIGSVIVGSILFVNFKELFRYINAAGTTIAPELTSEGAVATVKLHDLSEFIKEPVLLYRVVRNTLFILGGEYLGTTVGMWLGHMDHGLVLRSSEIAWFWILLLIAAVPGHHDEQDIGFSRRVILLLTGALLFLVILFSMLLAYTPADTWYILGVQGRYFLPFLPALLIALRVNRLPMMLSEGIITTFRGRHRGIPMIKRICIRIPECALVVMLTLNANILIRIFFIIVRRV